MRQYMGQTRWNLPRECVRISRKVRCQESVSQPCLRSLRVSVQRPRTILTDVKPSCRMARLRRGLIVRLKRGFICNLARDALAHFRLWCRPDIFQFNFEFTSCWFKISFGLQVWWTEHEWISRHLPLAQVIEWWNYHNFDNAWMFSSWDYFASSHFGWTFIQKRIGLSSSGTYKYVFVPRRYVFISWMLGQRGKVHSHVSNSKFSFQSRTASTSSRTRARLRSRVTHINRTITRTKTRSSFKSSSSVVDSCSVWRFFESIGLSQVHVSFQP